jgi:hypothetical protein
LVAIEYIETLRQGQSDYVAEIERLRRDVEMATGQPTLSAYGQNGGSIGVGVGMGGRDAGQEAIVAALKNSAAHAENEGTLGVDDVSHDSLPGTMGLGGV